MAAHTFALTDGTTTITFTKANGYFVQKYPMVPPESTGDSKDLAKTVTETLDMVVLGANAAAMQANVQAIDRMLITMRRRQKRDTGPRVFILATLDGDTTTWRSELVGASFAPAEDALRMWPNFTIEAQLHIERAAYWEDNTLRPLPGTNGNGTNNTSGLKIYNCGDSTGSSPNDRDNYFQIAAGDVGGSLPAPVRLEMTNTSGGGLQYSDLFIATNAFSDPANFTHILEAETVGVLGTYDVSTSGASNSGGYCVTGTHGSSWTFQANLSASLLAKAAGQDFHILQRLASTPTGAYVRPSIYDATGVWELRRGDETQIAVSGQALLDLGVLSLPPGGYSTAYGAQRLALAWRASPGTVLTDYWALFPTTGFRRLTALATIANNGTVVDDPIEDRAFALVGAVESPVIVRRAGPVMVWPNMLQRIYFLWADNISHDSVITQTMTVKAFYRPRRVTIG